MFNYAKSIAQKYHADQVRKYTGEPYMNHLENVANTVTDYYEDEDILAAAILHDILEDTTMKSENLKLLISKNVFDMVVQLTDVDLSVGNRALRKSLDRNRLEHADARVQTIKVADLIDNTSSIVEHDPKFARVYLGEKRLLLDVLKKAPHSLWMKANSQLIAARVLLEKDVD